MARTLKEIARDLNLSVSTISRALNAKKTVSTETRERILEEVSRTGYAPNQVARSLKNKSTKTIGIIIPDVCERFFSQIIKGLDEILSCSGYSIILVDTGENREKEEKYIDLLYQQRVDGLVIATVNVDSPKVLLFLSNEIPVVFIDNLPNISLLYDAVLIDNALASEIAVKRLVGRGHRRIAVIAGSPLETTGHDRLAGYRRTLEEAGLPVDERIIMTGNYKEDSGYACMERLLKGREQAPFSAVYVTSEMMTYGAVKAMRARQVRFPDDIALIGFDVHDKAGLLFPGITTVRQPEYEIGALTADILLQRLNGRHCKAGFDGAQSEGARLKLLNPYLEIKESD